MKQFTTLLPLSLVLLTIACGGNDREPRDQIVVIVPGGEADVSPEPIDANEDPENDASVDDIDEEEDAREILDTTPLRDVDEDPEPIQDDERFEGTLVLTKPDENSSRLEGAVELEISRGGLLSIAVISTIDLDSSAVGVAVCGHRQFGCQTLDALSANFEETWVPRRFLLEIEEPASIRVEFKTRASDLDEASTAVEINLLQWVEDSNSGSSPQTPLMLDLPVARRMHVDANKVGWYGLHVERPGYLRIFGYIGGNAYVCDAKQWRGIPALCPQSRPLAGGTPVTYLERPGEYFILADAGAHDSTTSFVAFFEPNQNEPVCSAGDHPGGAGECVPAGQCQAGYHDGGWGDCVPEHTCDAHFQIRDDGRCEGWLGAGYLPGFRSLINDQIFTLPDGSIFVSGYSESGDTPLRYDPARREWLQSTLLVESSPSTGTRFCPLADGRVLTVEFDGHIGNPPVRQERIFDLHSNTETVLTEPSGMAWTRPDCILLSDGKTLVYESTRAMLFDPTTKTWASAGNSLSGSQDPTGVESPSGDVYAAAGSINSLDPSRSLWKRASTTSEWTRTSEWPHTAQLTSWTRLVSHGDHIFAFSGERSNQTSTGDLTRYTISTNAWTQMAPMPVSHTPTGVATDETHGLAVWHNGAAAFYNLNSDTWRDLPVAPLVGQVRGLKPVYANHDTFVIVATNPLRYHVAP